MAPLNWCERCGKFFTASGTNVIKAATARGPLFDIPDSVCPSCMRPDEHNINGEVVTSEQLRLRQQY